MSWVIPPPFYFNFLTSKRQISVHLLILQKKKVPGRFAANWDRLLLRERFAALPRPGRWRCWRKREMLWIGSHSTPCSDCGVSALRVPSFSRVFPV
jgi:hypothetical protein